MQINEQDFLDMAEEGNKLLFVDIEATGLKGDYNSVLVVSALAYQDKKAVSFVVKQPGNDQRIVREAKEYLETFAGWVTYYGKGFDIPMLNTRLLRWGIHPIKKRAHIDLYFSLKYNILAARKSQAHLLRFLDCDEQKMDMSPSDWCTVIETGNLKKMTERCESDCAGLRSLYKKTRHLIRSISI